MSLRNIVTTKMSVVLLSLLLLCVGQFALSDPDYYWREYYGQIPVDAVEGGKDVRGNPTYIGQAFVLHHGILIGQIYPGQKLLITSKEGIHRTEVANKILCSPHKEDFVWVSGNAATLHLTTINKHLVPGGIEWGKVLNIGRVKYQGELIVGKVCSGTIGKAKLYFPYKGEEIEIVKAVVCVHVESYKGLSLASPVDHPSTIQLPTAQGVTYPTHALVYYCSAANRKAFSNTR